MKIFGFVVAALVAAIPTMSIAGSTVHVVDGDTIDVNDIRYRLHGIDAPEASQNAKALLEKIGNVQCAFDDKPSAFTRSGQRASKTKRFVVAPDAVEPSKILLSFKDRMRTSPITFGS